jgi:hypothetical protein
MSAVQDIAITHDPNWSKTRSYCLMKWLSISNLRFMHNYTHYNLTFSFEQLWMCKRDHLPNRVLRNADDLRNHFASIKRLPMFSFPQLWNEEPARKFNPLLKSYSKLLKLALSAPTVCKNIIILLKNILWQVFLHWKFKFCTAQFVQQFFFILGGIWNLEYLHATGGHWVQCICDWRPFGCNLYAIGRQSHANFSCASGQLRAKPPVFCKHAARTIIWIKNWRRH